MTQLVGEVTRVPLLGRAAVGVTGDRLEADRSRSAQRQVVGDGGSVGTGRAGGDGRHHHQESDQSEPADDTTACGAQPVAWALCSDRSAPGGGGCGSNDLAHGTHVGHRGRTVVVGGGCLASGRTTSSLGLATGAARGQAEWVAPPPKRSRSPSAVGSVSCSKFADQGAQDEQWSDTRPRKGPSRHR